MKVFMIPIFAMLISFNSKGQTIETVYSKNEEPILKVLSDFTDAWNKKDAKAFASIFSEDADFTNVIGKSAHGRNEIEKFHEPGFKTKWKTSYQKITKSKVRFIKPDVAAVDAWWELSGLKNADGQDMPQRKGLLNLIMTRNGDTWLITVMHNMDLP